MWLVGKRKKVKPKDITESDFKKNVTLTQYCATLSAVQVHIGDAYFF